MSTEPPRPPYGAPRGYGPPQGYGPPPQAAATRSGLRPWVAALIVLAALVAVWFAVGAAIPTEHAGASGAGSAAATARQSVDTRTRPPAPERTYPDPLPAALRPGWKVTDLETYGKGNADGTYTGATATTYAAWIVKLRKAGFVNTPGKKNDATNYDLHKGHTRLTGSFVADSAPAVIFVYDENGY